MGLFKFAELQEIAGRAIAAGLPLRRETLLFAFSAQFVAALPGWNVSAPADALRADLNYLNDIPEVVGDEVPISMWLKNASSIAMPRQALAKFFDDMALLAVRRAAEESASAGEPPQAPSPVAIPERILFKSALLPDSFVALAAARARSVARLSVFAYDAGAPRTLPSGRPDGVYGTGWLIGKRHLVTNWHVITARATGEPEPGPADLALQVDNLKVEFDYVAKDGQLFASKVSGLAHGDRALDYAILELADAEPRDPLPLASQVPEFTADQPVAANIVQHPAGEPRQYAIRNNLVAVLRGDELAYFTDTAGGSSGAPVCDDQWRVIALHKASSAQFGNFNFQGKNTAWVNMGTLIGAICDDLRQKTPELWTAIGPTVV